MLLLVLAVVGECGTGWCVCIAVGAVGGGGGWWRSNVTLVGGVGGECGVWLGCVCTILVLGMQNSGQYKT